MQLGLFTLGLLFRASKENDNIGVSISEGGATLLFGAIGMGHIYFSQEKFQATKVTYILLASTALLSFMMVPGYLDAMS